MHIWASRIWRKNGWARIQDFMRASTSWRPLLHLRLFLLYPYRSCRVSSPDYTCMRVHVINGEKAYVT